MALTKQQAFEEAVRRGLIDRSGKQLRPARPREMTPQTRFKQIDDEIGAEIRDATARQQTALDPLSWQTGLPTVDDVRIGAVRASPEAEAFGRSARGAVDALKGVRLGLPSAEQVREGVEGFGKGAVQLGESTVRGVGQAADSVRRDPLGAVRGFGEGVAKAAPAVGSFLGNMAWEMTGVPSMQRYVEGEGVYGQGLELGDKAMAGSGAVQSAVNSPGAFYAVPGIVEGSGLVRDAIGLGAKMLPKMGKKEALKGVGPQFDGNVGREFQPAIRVGGKTYDADMNLLRDLGPAVSISGVEPEVKSIIESALKYARGDRGKAIENLRADMSEWAGADPVLANRYRAALAKLKDQGGPPPAEDLGAEIRAIKAQVDDAVNPDPFSEWIEGGPMASVPPREAMQNTLIGRERLVDEGRKRAGIAPLTMDEIIEAGREEGPRLGRRLEETTGIYGLGGRREGTPMLQTALGAGAGGTLGYLATPKDAEASVGDGDGSTGALATAGLGAILGGALTRGKGARLAVKGLGGKEIPVFKNPTPAQLRTLGAENKGGLKFVLDDNGDRYVFPEFFYHDEVAKGLHDSGAPFKTWDWGGEHSEARGVVNASEQARTNRLEPSAFKSGTSGKRGMTPGLKASEVQAENDRIAEAYGEWAKKFPPTDVRAGTQGSEGSIANFARSIGVTKNKAQGVLTRRGLLGGAPKGQGKWSLAPEQKTIAPSADEVTEGAARLGMKPERYAALSAKRKSNLAVPAAVATGGLTGLSALGAPEARAQEADSEGGGISNPLISARERVRALESAAAAFSKVDPSDRASVIAAQRALQARGLYVEADGTLGPETARAISEYRGQVNAELAAARKQLKEAEQQEAARATRASPGHEALRELGPWAATLGAVALGYGSRSGAVKKAGAELATRNRKANALLNVKPLSRSKSAAKRAEAMKRAANLNEFWRLGGAGERVPLTAKKTGDGFRARPGAASPSELFPPESARFRANDVGVIGAGLGESALSGGAWYLAEQELAKAQAAVDKDPSEANLARLERARDMVAAAQSFTRAGLGFAAGRTGAAVKQPYANARPNIAKAEAEKALLLDHFKTPPRRRPKK